MTTVTLVRRMMQGEAVGIFRTKAGKTLRLVAIDPTLYDALTAMYLAFEPRNSFHGLPPIGDDACVKWVEHMIANGTHLVAVTADQAIVGHVGIFPINRKSCEMLVVVVPLSQNVGLGTELVRNAASLARQHGFESVQILVESKNTRARHIYKKCGFEYLNYTHVGEVDMTLDLTVEK